MPNNSYGSTIRDRVWYLLKAIVDFANGEVDDIDNRLRLRPKNSKNSKIQWKDEDIQPPYRLLVDRISKHNLADLTCFVDKNHKLTPVQVSDSLKILCDFLRPIDICEDHRSSSQGGDGQRIFTLSLWFKAPADEKRRDEFNQKWELCRQARHSGNAASDMTMGQSNPENASNLTSAQIFLCYGSDRSVDATLAQQIAQELGQHHQVFTEEQIGRGEPRSHRIQQELENADALIVLLSEQAGQSELIHDIVTQAQELQGQRSGLPRILPVRIKFHRPFSYPLNTVLDPLPWALWDGEEDTSRLVQELQGAIAGHPLPIATTTEKQAMVDHPDGACISSPNPTAQPPGDQMPFALPLETPEGSMDAESRFYIERKGDKAAYLALLDQREKGETVTILGPRQMGKSSLLIRLMTQARVKGKQVAFLDFQQLDQATLNDAELFYRHFCEWLTILLDMPSEVDSFWQKYRCLGTALKCTYYVKNYLLKTVDSPIFLAMDEMDKLITSPFRDEFFGLLRSWHNARSNDPTVWRQFDLVMVTCTEPYQLIQDLNQSPFNVGTSIRLKDFNLAEVAELNHRHGEVLKDSELTTLIKWVGGHPYLLRKALYLIASKQLIASELFESIMADWGPFGEHLRYHLFRMDDKSHLVQGLLQVMCRETCEDEQVLRRLEGAGLVRREGHQIQPRCRLYAEYFKEHLHE